ncbi:MAG: cupin domain-containing protein [Kofleriaceae bacterium]
MTLDLRELLSLYALGILEPEEAITVERAVAAEPGLARDLASYRDAGALLAGDLDADPAPEVHARLLASTGAGRFEQLAARIGALYDVALDRARELLGLIERPGSWHPEIPGIELLHFEGGPACATADCGFVRMRPGAVFPLHGHVGEEACIVLAGTIRDVTHDRVLGAGDEYVQPAGSSHALVCEGDEVCLFAARAIEGIEVAGAPARPGMPRG